MHQCRDREFIEALRRLNLPVLERGKFTLIKAQANLADWVLKQTFHLVLLIWLLWERIDLEMFTRNDHLALPLVLFALLLKLLLIRDIISTVTEDRLEIGLVWERRGQILTTSNEDRFTDILRPIHLSGKRSFCGSYLLNIWVAQIAKLCRVWFLRVLIPVDTFVKVVEASRSNPSSLAVSFLSGNLCLFVYDWESTT